QALLPICLPAVESQRSTGVHLHCLAISEMRAQIVRERAGNLDLSSKCTGQARNALPQDLARGAKRFRLQCGLSLSGPRSARSNGNYPLEWMLGASRRVQRWGHALTIDRSYL